jgi:hypothetical protein
MELDVSMDNDSLAIPIDNPFHMDMDTIMVKIESFAVSKGASTSGLDVRGLLPRMVRGIAGCESGCPADAKGLVSAGFGDFKLEYVEGGILTAKAATRNGKELSLKMFPDF